MKAVCWCGSRAIRVEQVRDPQIINPRDAIIQVRATAICGSDLHLYTGCIPTMQRGDILGHEFMGNIVEVGPGVKNLEVGDRVVIPFPIACGNCHFCQSELFSLCVKHAVYLTSDRLHALRQSIHACRKGGTVSIPGVYGGYLDKVPFGAAFAKGLQLRMGQTHVHRYVQPLMERIERGEVDPSDVVSHRGSLEDAPSLYKTFHDKVDRCTKVVLKP